MVLKWGSTTVTAVKWGSTTCTAVYWGSTKIFPDSPFAILTSIWTGYQIWYNSGWKYGNQNSSGAVYGSNTMATVSGKVLTANYVSSSTCQGQASLVTSSKVTCSGTITATVNLTTYKKNCTIYLKYGASLPNTATTATSTDPWSSWTNAKTVSPTATGTQTASASISGTYYLCVQLQAGSGGNVIGTVTGLT